MELKSERLVIRSYVYEDYDAWIEGHRNRLVSQSRHDEGRPTNMAVYTMEWFEKKVDHLRKQDREMNLYELGLFRKNDGAYVGKVEIYRTSKGGQECVLLGYAIHNQYWRLGYGKESLTAIIPFVFQYLQPERVELHIDVDNDPSIQLAESVGFIYEQKQSQFSFESGEWSEFYIYYLEKP